jgi:hypothetical protein
MTCNYEILNVRGKWQSQRTEKMGLQETILAAGDKVQQVNNHVT